MKWLYYTVLLLACCRMAGCGSGGAGVCGPDGRIQGSRTLGKYGGYDS